LTLDCYLEVEARHLRVVAAFLEESVVDAVRVRDAEPYNEARWWPTEGEVPSRVETIDVVRELLRERGFCRLEADRGLYIHVGYDYYLYVGGDVACERTLDVARKAGLFVDADFVSPYHLDPETGEYL
jgi:small subunit ribosomal protein S1